MSQNNWRNILGNLSQYLTKFMYKICFTISFILCLYMFRTHVLIIRRSKLHYTASGIITPIGGRLVHQTATYRCDNTRGRVVQLWPTDDEHICSKHVEAWNKTYCETNFCASIWLNTEINILRCTVSKTSKKIIGNVSDKTAYRGCCLTGYQFKLERARCSICERCYRTSKSH